TGIPRRGISVFDLDGRESGVDWRRILSALLRFKWLIATTTLVGTIAGVGATRFLKPQYSAQAKIWIDVEGRRGPERGPTPIRSGQLLDAESWVEPRSGPRRPSTSIRSEEHTSELQSRFDLVCRLLLEKKKLRAPRNGTPTTSCPPPRPPTHPTHSTARLRFGVSPTMLPSTLALCAVLASESWTVARRG